MLFRVSDDMKPISRNIGFIAISICVINITRILLDLAMPTGDDFISSNPYDTSIVLAIQMMFIALAFNLVLTVNRRLVEDLEKDIQIRKQTEEALLERERLYRQMFTEHTAVMLLIEPNSGQIIEANPAAANFYGHPVEVLQQMNINHINVSPSEKVDQDRQAAATGIQNHFFFSHRLASDEIRDVEVYSVPIHIEGSRLLYSIIHDITERVKAEQALEESENKHRTMIANISDVVAVMDTNGIIQYKSPNVEKHFGWRPEDLVGTNGWDTIHPDDLERMQEEFFALLQKTNATKTVEYRYKRKDGEYSLIELTATNLTNDPQINGVLMNYHDVTVRKTMENELKSQKSFFEQTFIQSATSTQILDASGWCLRINPKLSELFGVQPEQMEGRLYNIFNDAEIKRHGIDKILKRVYKQQKVEKWEVHFDIGTAADSQNVEVEQKIKVWYANKAYPIVDSNGVLTNVIIQHEDITERKKAEQAVQDALQDKEVLLRELYHRTKNNMQVISSMLNLEIDRVEDRNSQRILQDMDNRIRSMALVHQKLYQSQSLSSIDLRDYLSDLTNLIMANYQVEPENVTFSIEAEPIQVLIDTAIPCGLIVNEIVSNALKYAFPDQGKGEIKVRLLRSKKTDAAKINLEISDNGIGIPQEHNLQQSDTLGVQTIFGVAKHQLNAVVNLETNHGVSWQIQFEDDLYSSRV
jgi:PAS domain S-box-containing protein